MNGEGGVSGYDDEGGGVTEVTNAAQERRE